MKYIIGIDSGATLSEGVLFPLDGGKAVTKTFPPVNISITVAEEASKRLVKMVKDISKNAGSGNITAIAAGISGAGYERDRKKLKLALKKASGIKHISILPDTETAFCSAFEPGDKNCGILIAGTGSILYYKDKHGKALKIGGWGRHIGDEGSGFWIAREALSAAAKQYDGRHKKTMLADMLKKKYGILQGNIIKKVYHNGFEISQAAECVFRCAESGDKISREIIRSAAEALLAHFVPLRNKDCSIALAGSLFTKETLLEKYLRRQLKEKYSSIKLVKPGQKPVWGAVKIALTYNS